MRPFILFILLACASPASLSLAQEIDPLTDWGEWDEVEPGQPDDDTSGWYDQEAGPLPDSGLGIRGVDENRLNTLDNSNLMDYPEQSGAAEADDSAVTYPGAEVDFLNSYQLYEEDSFPKEGEFPRQDAEAFDEFEGDSELDDGGESWDSGESIEQEEYGPDEFDSDVYDEFDEFDDSGEPEYFEEFDDTRDLDEFSQEISDF